MREKRDLGISYWVTKLQVQINSNFVRLASTDSGILHFPTLRHLPKLFLMLPKLVWAFAQVWADKSAQIL